MLNNKNVSEKFFDPAEIKRIFQSQNNIATPVPTGDKLINQPISVGERNVVSNNSPLLPSIVENKISIYEAQYASRLGMAVVEKARAGQENFDIHLTPESFGKIKVNVNLDFRAMDVKIFTETLAAAAIFKDHENTLQQIMEQNGMKLASFSVGSQSSNDQQRQFANQNKDRTIGKVAGRGNKDLIASDMLENSKDEPSGLNLIA
jgi:flagellar hook-length control protein FliK